MENPAFERENSPECFTQKPEGGAHGAWNKETKCSIWLNIIRGGLGKPCRTPRTAWTVPQKASGYVRGQVPSLVLIPIPEKGKQIQVNIETTGTFRES